MKTEDKKEAKVFQLANIKPYEELVNDEREYSPNKSLEELNLYLQTSKYGVVIAGKTGTGKTALVRQFANQNLNRVFKMDNVKVIRFKDGYFASKLSIEQIVNIISDVILSYKSDAIILYVKLQKKEDLDMIKSVSPFLSELVKFYNLQSLKLIIEATTKNRTEMEYVIQETGSLFNIITCDVPENMNATINTLMPRIDEMSIEYGVGYNRDVLRFFYVIAFGLNKEQTITNTYLNVLECAFTLSKKHDFTVLDKSVAKYIDKTAFEKLDKMSEEQKQLVAAHEAGHTLLSLVSGNKTVGFVSIIPGTDYVGVTMWNEENNTFKIKDREFFIKDIAICLAGRIGEAVFSGKENPTDSAVCDLKNAMNKLNYMISSLGLSKSMGSNYVIANEKDQLSENLKIWLEAEKKEVLIEAGDYAQRVFVEHKQFFLELSKKVADELVICNEELYSMWNEYLESKKKTENT